MKNSYRSVYDEYDEPCSNEKGNQIIHSLAGQCTFCGIVKNGNKLVY